MVIVSHLWFPVHFWRISEEIWEERYTPPLTFHSYCILLIWQQYFQQNVCMETCSWIAFHFHIQVLFSFPLILHPSACTCAKSLQLGPTLCDPMDYSPPGSSVHGVLSFPSPYKMGFQLHLPHRVFVRIKQVKVKCFTICLEHSKYCVRLYHPYDH